MTRQPEEKIEAAIKSTVDFLEQHKARLSPETSREKMRFWMAVGLYGAEMRTDGFRLNLSAGLNERRAAELVEKADRGDADAQVALRHVIIELLDRDVHPLPDPLQEYHRRFLRSEMDGPAKPGQKPNDHVTRDVLIAEVVWNVKRTGFKPTRNRSAHGSATKAESACSIVTKALERIGVHLSERRVENIWGACPHLH